MTVISMEVMLPLPGPPAHSCVLARKIILWPEHEKAGIITIAL